MNHELNDVQKAALLAFVTRLYGDIVEPGSDIAIERARIEDGELRYTLTITAKGCIESARIVT